MVAAMFGTSGTVNCGDPAYAGLEARFTFSGGVCSAANVQRVATYNFNSADVATSGIDVQASYELRAGGGWVQAGVAGSHAIEYEVGDVTVEGISVQPAFDAAGLLNYQTTAYPIPRWKGQAWLQGEFGPHLLRVQANHVGGYTDQRAIFAAMPAGQKIAGFTTVDATWRWSLATGTTVALSLHNILGEDPPFARLDQNYDPFTADPLGFTAKLGVSQRF
jgi:iron complex outermembrane receptor protein